MQEITSIVLQFTIIICLIVLYITIGTVMFLIIEKYLDWLIPKIQKLFKKTSNEH